MKRIWGAPKCQDQKSQYLRVRQGEEFPNEAVDDHSAHRVYNVIGEKDWSSRFCNGLFKSWIGNEEADVSFINQHETKSVIKGHYFEQADYQK